MPEVQISIGGRNFTVACQPGEEDFLKSAAGLLDAEASALTDQIGRLPESRMLLMAGLMLADKAAGTDDQFKALEEQLAAQQERIAELENRGPEKVEVAVVPPQVTETLAELAARAEAMADRAEERASA